jgi:hypothetical protein
MSEKNYDKAAVFQVLNRVLELELAGVVRYTHYSFMVFGYNRIPIVGWLRSQAGESLMHAQEAGELIRGHLAGIAGARVRGPQRLPRPPGTRGGLVRASRRIRTPVDQRRNAARR